MSNYVKKYDVGEIALDLPYNSFIHELPLLSFKDFTNSVSISLIHNHKLKIDNSNLFNVGVGYKLNIQKKIIIENNVPTKLIESNGKYVNLISNSNSLDSTVSNGLYTFDDESKRILRVLSNGFEIENYDFSKEKYNSLGNIIESYDKYGDEYLTYTYDSSNKLINVSYNGKVVSFGYYNNDLTSISYGGTTTTLVYNNPNMTIIHYSGVRYYITVTDTEYTVVGRDNSGSGIFSKSKICEYSGNEIVLKNKIKTDIIDEVTYRFPSSVTSGYKSYTQVEITSKEVQQRAQYYNDKLLYSYELDYDYDDVRFYDNRCTSDVLIHNTLREDEHNAFRGELKHTDGTLMSMGNKNQFSSDVSIPQYSNAKGYYLLSGWIKSENINSNNWINISNYSGGSTYSFYVPIGELNKWHFFAYPFQLDANTIYVLASQNFLTIKDLRLTYNVSHILDESKKSHALFKEDIFVNENRETIPLNDIEFKYTTKNNEQGLINLTVSDILRCMRKSVETNEIDEISFNNGKNAINNLEKLEYKLKESTDQ